MSYKFNLYNIFRFNRNSGEIKQLKIADKLKYIDKSSANVDDLTASLDNIAKDAYNDASKTYSKRSPYNMLLTAFKEVSNMSLLYIYRAVNNYNISTADNINAVKGLASLTGFVAQNKIASSGAVNVYLKNRTIDSNSVLIYNGAQLTNKVNGLSYFVHEKSDFTKLHLTNNNALTLNIVQGYRQQLSFTGNGKPLQIFTIESMNIDMSLFEVFVNGVKCVKVSRLADMSINDNAYIVRHNMQGGINIFFGNGSNGLIPAMNASIDVYYIVCNGTLGDAKINDEFVFVNGVTDEFGDYVDTKNMLTISAQSNFMGGYDGDDIEAIRLNAGLQTTSNILTTVDNYFSFMRKYPHIHTVDVWSEPSISTVNMLVVPNLSQICSNRLCSYFDLSYADFEFDDDERDMLHSNIVSDRQYALMSALQLYSYDLVPYGVIVFANIKKMSNTNTVYNKIIANLHDAILQEYANNAQVLRASILQNVLQDNIDELNHIKVQFTGDSTYINEFGDIDTRNNITAENKLILPYITKGSYNNMDFFDMPFKVLVKHTNADSWTELIKNNADYES
jgi:hypothetical protein